MGNRYMPEVDVVDFANKIEKLHDQQLKFIEQEAQARKKYYEHLEADEQRYEDLISKGFIINEKQLNKLKELKEKQLREANELDNALTEDALADKIKATNKALDDQFKYGKKIKARSDKAEKADTFKKLNEIAEQEHLIGKEKEDYLKKQIAERYELEAEEAEKLYEKLKKQSKTAAVASFASNFASGLESTVDEIGKMKSAIDTRLYGSKQTSILGSYWSRMQMDMATINTAVAPFVKQSDLSSKIKEMVSSGISFNVEQRAFLSVISEKIATTFDSNNSALARLVRIQQQDSTSARLGMESAMTAFLNNMYETTEYLSDVANEVRNNLAEAEALMGTKQAVEFDYQVQKWLGSLYSVGFNNTSAISSALGKLAAGDISGITNDGVGNLLIMSANNAGLSISDILANGLGANTANDLLQAMVSYLAGIYNESKGSKVVQQQFANVFGLAASDLKAAANLIDQNNSTLKAIYGNNLTYDSALFELRKRVLTMGLRTSTGEMMDNVWDNIKYGISSGIASNPATYAALKAGNFINSELNGLDFSLPLVMGSGSAQTFKLSDIMKIGALGGGILGSMGQLLGGLFTGGLDTLSSALGIGSNTATVARGKGTGLTTSGRITTSESGYVGNSSGSDVYNATTTSQTDSTNQQVVEATESEEADIKNKVIDEHLVDFYNLVKDVVDGGKSFKVDMGNAFAWTAAIAAGNIIV